MNSDETFHHAESHHFLLEAILKWVAVFAALHASFAYTAYETWPAEFAGGFLAHTKCPSNKEMPNVKLGATVKEAALKAANYRLLSVAIGCYRLLSVAIGCYRLLSVAIGCYRLLSVEKILSSSFYLMMHVSIWSARSLFTLAAFLYTAS
jgi:hypothetical protein